MAVWVWRVPVCIFLAGLSLDAACQIYVGSDASQASIVLSNFKSDVTPELLVAVPDGAANAAKSRVWTRSSRYIRQEDLQPMIESIARKIEIAPDLINAVIAVESDYDPSAVSRRGAIGLMQLLPATAQRFGVDSPYDAYSNITAGAKYLKWLMGFFDNDIELVLAAYNAGEQAVIKAGRRVPDYPETKAYVRRVVARL